MAKRVIIGVTGGLATGKTTVADMFAGKGALKIDADEIAHRILSEENEIKYNVIDLFGDSILTGGDIDRRKLAKTVFLNKEKLNDLCCLLHPAIIRCIKKQVEESRDEVIVIDAPLLIEAHLDDYVDIIVVVISKEETQINRAVERGISPEEAKNVIGSQMPVSEKAKLADHIIDSDKNMDIVKKGVDEIWQKL